MTEIDKPKKEDYWLPPGDGDAGHFFAESEYEAAMEMYWESRLKPCPFCGGDAVLQQTGRNKMRVICRECIIEKEQKVLYKSLDWLREKLIESWNKRTDNH